MIHQAMLFRSAQDATYVRGSSNAHRRSPSRRAGATGMLVGVVLLMIGVIVLRGMLSGSAGAAGIAFPPLLLFWLAATIGMPVTMIAIGLSAFYRPRWLRAMIVTTDRRLRLRTPHRYDPIEAWAAPLYMLRSNEFLRFCSCGRRIGRMLVRFIGIVAVSLLAGDACLTLAGLLIGVYQGPFPPASASQAVHASASGLATMLVNQPVAYVGMHFPLLLVWLACRRSARDRDRVRGDQAATPRSHVR